jgi:adenine deaminase
MTTLEAKEVAERLKNLRETVAMLGCKVEDPFMTLSFLALPVIPKLKITDHGLVDVEKFEVVDLFIE